MFGKTLTRISDEYSDTLKSIRDALYIVTGFLAMILLALVTR